jgi:hypothetical protein
MKKLFLLTLMSSSIFLNAELWKDYEPSEQQIQLTVIDVQPNYLDYYLVNLNKTWVKTMEVQKDLGHIVDYGVFTSDGASSPNVWLTVTYADMASMRPSKTKYDAVNAELSKRYGDNEEELDKISKGYEEIRTMIDNQRINQVIFK